MLTNFWIRRISLGLYFFFHLGNWCEKLFELIEVEWRCCLVCRLRMSSWTWFKTWLFETSIVHLALPCQCSDNFMTSKLTVRNFSSLILSPLFWSIIHLEFDLEFHNSWINNVETWIPDIRCRTALKLMWTIWWVTSSTNQVWELTLYFIYLKIGAFYSTEENSRLRLIQVHECNRHFMIINDDNCLTERSEMR